MQHGFKTKTQLQRLSESYVDFEPPKINKKKKDEPEESDEESDEKTEDKKDSEPQQKLLIGIKKEITNLFNYSSRKLSKSKKDADNVFENIKSRLNLNRLTFAYNLTINAPFLSISRFFC